MEKVKDSRFELIDSSKLDGDLVVRPNISYWKDAWRKIEKIHSYGFIVYISSYYIDVYFCTNYKKFRLSNSCHS